MNKQRRKELNKALNLVEEIKSVDVDTLTKEEIAKLLDKKSEAITIIETVRDEEQDYYDNMPESLQGGDKGSAAEEAISNLEDALSYLEDADIEWSKEKKEGASEEEKEEYQDEMTAFFEEADSSLESAVDSINSAIDG